MNTDTLVRNPRHSIPTLLAACCVAFAALACGGGDSSTPPREETAAPPSVDLCGLLTPTDIEDAIGTSVGEPTSGTEGKGQCTWPKADGSGAAVVLVLDDADFDSFDDFVTDFGVQFGGENPPRDRFHPVEGLGDWAMYQGDDDMVRVFVDDEELDVTANGAEEAQIADLAGRAIARMP